jgi:hypothetical protein
MPQRNDVKLGVMLDDPSEVIARVAGGAGDLDPVAKADALLTAIERSEALKKAGVDGPVARANALLDEVESSSDPATIAKRAREDALAKWRAEPVPPKTFGPGMVHLPGERVEAMAKARGFGMRESDYLRKL